MFKWILRLLIAFTVVPGWAQLPTTGSSFTIRCQSPGVVKCVGFESSSDISGSETSNSGLLSGATINPVIDSSQHASGASSLKFTVPSQSGPSASGAYFTNFSTNLATQFGENSEFYVQWRQRFSPEFLSTQFAGGNGWKQSIIGTGDVGSTHYYTCTDLEVVSQNTYYYGFPQMYDSCSAHSTHPAFEDFWVKLANSDLNLQNATSPACLYSKRPTFSGTGCLKYFPNEWMTFEVHIKTGPRVSGEFSNSHVDLWVARQDQPAQQALNWGPYPLNAGSASLNQKFGKIWLIPYNTNKSSSTSYPISYTWYDDLIVSTQPIPIFIAQSQTVSQSIAFTHDGQNTTRYEYALDSAPSVTFVPSPLAGVPGDWTLTLTNLTSGSHTISINACNLTGCATSMTLTFTATAQPQPAIPSPPTNVRTIGA